MQELVEGGKISVHYVKSEDQLTDLGTKHLSKHRHRNVIRLINEFKAQNPNTLIVFQGDAIIFLREEYLRMAQNFQRTS